MREPDRNAALHRALREWFDLPLGRSLQALEVHQLRTVLPPLHGTTALQLGRIGRLEMLDSCGAPTRIVLDHPVEADGPVVNALPEELPFDARSLDIVVLPHTLDFCDDPHQVLREVDRALTPEGHVVIFGFNPLSLWGLRRAFTRRPRSVPWSGRFLRLARVKDWLKLLDLDLTHGSMLYYRPPLARQGLMDRLHFLDKMGDRWWPMMAAVYLMVARKRVAGMTPLRVEWKLKPALGRVLPNVAGRGAVVRIEEWRKRALGQG
jgi:SAM-dependent methyltransferase